MLRNTRLSPCIVFAWILSSLLTHAAFASFPCDTAFELGSDTIWPGVGQREESAFRWLLPSPGIATLDLLTTAPGSARIHRRAGACAGTVATFAVLEASPTHLVLAVHTAGYLDLATHVGAESFRIVTGFTPATVVEQTVDFGDPNILAKQSSFFVANLAGKSDPEVVDPDPGGLRIGGSRLAARLLTLARTTPRKADPEVVDPDPGGLRISGGLRAPADRTAIGTTPPLADPEVVDPDPGGLRAGGNRFETLTRHVLVFDPICHLAETDDHGDTAACATPLPFGRVVSGALSNDWDDDSDVFSFDVTETSRIEITLDADTDITKLTFALSGPTGQRLAVDTRPSRDEAGLHLVTTLPSGRYFFRVSGTSGAYALHTMAYE